jgi:hypothetical protein
MIAAQSAKRCDLASAHESAARHLTICISLPQAQQDLSVLEHFESPASHR